MLARIKGSLAPLGVSSWRTRSLRAPAYAWVRACAWRGSGSVTLRSMITVSGTTVASTAPMSSPVVIEIPTSSMTVWASSSLLPTRSAYDVTRCWENCAPVKASPTDSPEFDEDVETKTRAVDWYCGVEVNVHAAAAPTTSNVKVAMSIHRRRRMRR